MGFQDLTILRSYKTNKNDIVKEFYIPILKQATLYRRAVGFFSSTALIELSKGIAGLIKNNGRIEFIVSPLLSEEDIEAIKRGYDEREIISKSLLREFREPKNKSEAERLNWLASLIATGRLEIKVAFTPPQKTTGMYHEKIGVLYDAEGNRIAFTGSMNETINAFHNNYESIVVFNSLVSEDLQRVNDLEADFNSLWEGKEDNISIVDFPQVVTKKLTAYKKGELPPIDYFEVEDNADLLPPAIGIPMIPQGVSLHEYQQDAIEEWAKQDYRGIFDMATGTGKT